MLNEKQIQDNWNQLLQLIEDTFEGERKEKLLEMYKYFEDRMMFAPASGTEHFHNCFPGGYVEHILNIVRFSKQFYEVWVDNGSFVSNYTMEELVFAGMHHDLGKVGDFENDNYIPNDSEWHRKNQGKIYTHNPDLQFMSPPDRGIWLLNQFGIKMSQIEMLGIRLADGMYDEANVKYLKTFNKDHGLKCNLPYILHQADMATTRIEFEKWFHSDDEVVNTKVPKTKDEKEKVDNLKQKFDELFAS